MKYREVNLSNLKRVLFLLGYVSFIIPVNLIKLCLLLEDNLDNS